MMQLVLKGSSTPSVGIDVVDSGEYPTRATILRRGGGRMNRLLTLAYHWNGVIGVAKPTFFIFIMVRPLDQLIHHSIRRLSAQLHRSGKRPSSIFATEIVQAGGYWVTFNPVEPFDCEQRSMHTETSLR